MQAFLFYCKHLRPQFLLRVISADRVDEDQTAVCFYTAQQY